MLLLLARPPAPFLDEDGLLRLGERWTPIPDTQIPIARAILERPMQVVRIDEITELYAAAGGTAARGAIRSMLCRLSARFRQVGLELVSVRSRGVLLNWAPT